MSTDRRANALTRAELDWEGAAPRARRFGDVYFSGDGLAEARHVFLAGNDLERRFAAARRFSIAELGFGTGLNMLAAWALWRRVARPDARLELFSVEAYPLGAGEMARAHGAWPELAALAARLRALLPAPARGFHRLALEDGVALTLAYDEAQAALEAAEGAFDAWFLDGFAPAKNPDMWRTELFAEAARLSAPGATFATFTVAGEVRRALLAAGFAHDKRPGFGRKREMLAGRIESPRRASRRAPWHRTAQAPLPPGARIAVIGGGIAGASLAFEALRAGLAPTIIERETLAAGASGNRAGLIMPRLDLSAAPPARFHLLAYLHAIRLLTEFGETLPALFHPCGALLGAGDEEGRARLERIAAEELLPPAWIEGRAGALFFPQAGVVDPRAFVAALAQGVEIIPARALRLARSAKLDVIADRGRLAGFDAVILANGAGALDFLEARALPLAAIAGQIDVFPGAAAPRHALAFGAYAAPAPPFGAGEGGLVIGASYQPWERERPPSPSQETTLAAIARVSAFAPDLAAALDPARAQPRASLRCATPDRLPVVGPLPDLAFYAGAYDGLRTGLKADYPPGEAIPGVFALTGLGSRGLVTAPLCAAALIAEMTGAPSPVGAGVAEALHPARFFIRSLKRARAP